MKSYDLFSRKLPGLTGSLLDVFAAAADGKWGFLLKGSLMKNGGIHRIMLENFDEAPLFEPLHGEWTGPGGGECALPG